MRQRLTAVAMAALMVFALLAAAPAVTVAGHDTDDGDASFIDRLVNPEEKGFGASIAERVMASVSSVTKTVASITTDSDAAADEHADAFQQTFNNDSAAFTEYADQRVEGDGNHTLFRVTFEDRDENTADRYLDATWNETEESYTDAEVITPQTFDDRNYTDDDVDGYIELDWYASENAADELDEFHEDFVEEDKDVTMGYRLQMLRKYAESVDSDLF